jgi:DNA-binding GntR family transcriptional regulator
METQWSHIQRVMLMTLEVRSYRDQVWDEHESILDAIVKRDVSRAREVASAHAREARAFLAASLQQSAAMQQES